MQAVGHAGGTVGVAAGLTAAVIIDNDSAVAFPDPAASATPSATFGPLQTAPVGTRVFEALRAAIFDGRLQPGDPLRELHLARQLNVSQAPVREALVKLERLGLVIRTPNVGTHVTRLSEQDVRERIELRALLEERAMLAAASRMTPEAFAGLDDRLETLTRTIRHDAYFEQARADLDLHRFIWQQTGNQTLYRTLDDLAVPLFAFASILRGASRQSLRHVVQSHEELVDALRGGRADDIHRAVERHFASAST